MDNFLDWHKNFKLDIDLSKYNNILEYIKKLDTIKNNKTIEYKISQIEEDYIEKVKYIKELFNNTIAIDKLKQSNSLVILQKELEIIKILTKYTLQNKSLDYNFFKICLSLLLDFSETLRKRLGQKEINHDKTKKDSKIVDDISYIMRCSYKFCSYQGECSYNYNKGNTLCYQDHYVHNMVSADLKILLHYINDKFEKLTNISHTKEILKTINTLSFVISHMEAELKTKCLYLPEKEWENCHVVKNK